MIATVEPGSPAERAGLVSGDIILALDGIAVTGADDLIRMLAGEKIGRAVEIETLRNGSRRRVVAGAGRAAAPRLITRRRADGGVPARPAVSRPQHRPAIAGRTARARCRNRRRRR